MQARPRTWLTTFCLALMAAAMVVPASVAQNDPKKPAAAEGTGQEGKVAKLIEQLGSGEFAAREKAQAELAKIGLEAFDALNDAQHHDDVEISLRARFLVRAMQVQWYHETDSADVIKVLKLYGEQSETDRRSRIDRLKILDERQGLPALCRLARFEPSEELSKYAALKVLELLPEIKDEKVREDVGKKVVAGAGSGKRTATAWLRTFAKTLPDVSASIPEWEAHIKAEHDLFTQFPDRTSREVVRDLYRFEVSLLQSLGREQESVAVMRKTLSLLEGTADQLTELIDWLLERKAWPVVQEVADRFPKPLVDNPELIYRLAEAQNQDGKTEAAQQTAAKALALRPDDVQQHFRLGIFLQQRGMFTWAENEFRYLLSHVPEDSVLIRIEVQYALSEMLHDIGKELPAAEVAKGGVDLLAKNAQARELPLRPQAGWISRMHYFYALDLMEKGKLDEARKHLEDGAAADPTDADVLIALFRWPNQTPEQQASIRKLVTAATESFEKDIEKFKQAGDNPADPFSNDKREHATACNQYAWLVSNTFGDFDKAIRASHKSVEIRQEMRQEVGAYYDTLGRCYFAKGDLANAIKYQKQALKFDPHSGQMKRQLALFEKAKAEKEN